jgi:hypothetical protein
VTSGPAAPPEATTDELCARAAEAYEEAFGPARLDRIDLAGTPPGYLFDSTDAGDGPAPRIVAAWTTSHATRSERDRSFVRGFPLPRTDHPIDRGHLIAWSTGGADHLGINLIPQDRALNRGTSRAGSRWRALERAAASTTGTFIWLRATYDDTSDIPCTIDRLQITPDGDATFDRFPNRPDTP